jgi:hypothetical protein
VISGRSPDIRPVAGLPLPSGVGLRAKRSDLGGEAEAAGEEG